MAEDDYETGGLFEDPEGFYEKDPEPTFAEHQMLNGQTVRVRLVGSHPLYVCLKSQLTRTPRNLLTHFGF